MSEGAGVADFDFYRYASMLHTLIIVLYGEMSPSGCPDLF